LPVLYLMSGRPGLHSFAKKQPWHRVHSPNLGFPLAPTLQSFVALAEWTSGQNWFHAPKEVSFTCGHVPTLRYDYIQCDPDAYRGSRVGITCFAPVAYIRSVDCPLALLGLSRVNMQCTQNAIILWYRYSCFLSVCPVIVSKRMNISSNF